MRFIIEQRGDLLFIELGKQFKTDAGICIAFHRVFSPLLMLVVEIIIIFGDVVGRLN